MKDEQCPIEGMIITVVNQKTLEPFELLSDANGQFSCKLNKGVIYDLEYHKANLMSRSDMIDPTNSAKNKLFVKEEFDQLEIGAIVLENILYDFNKFNIREDAAIELDKLVVILMDNPNLMIELSSWGDNFFCKISRKTSRDALRWAIVYLWTPIWILDLGSLP